MKIYVKAKPGAKENRVEALLDPAHLHVWVKEPAHEGRANLAVIREVALHFGVPKSSLEMTSGFKSKQKILILRTK